MLSGVIESSPVVSPVVSPVLAMPAVTVIPAPVAEPVPPAVAHIAAPARQPAHAGDDTAFSDQIINWMRQGDRLADPRPVEDLSLLDVAEPTDPVAHELLDSTKRRARPLTRSGRVGRWISVGALGVAMSFGLYWAALEPRSAAGYAVAVPAQASVAEMAPVIAPAVAPPAPAVAPGPPAAPAAAAQSAGAEKATLASAAHHKHHRGAGGIHHRRTH
jgi:hypothetical protein